MNVDINFYKGMFSMCQTGWTEQLDPIFLETSLIYFNWQQLWKWDWN